MCPKISVVMPAYNAERYIAQAFESLINQTFEDWECLVVDDASTDGTLQIIKTYATREPRIKYQIRTENSGSAKIPRDIAIAMANSDWILSLDADDYFAPDTLEKLWLRQAETCVDAVLLKLVRVDENGNLQMDKHHATIPSKDFNFSQILTGLEAAKLTIGKWTIAGNGLFHKRLFVSRRPIRNYMNADEYDTRQKLIAAKTVAFSDAHYYYRKVTSSITQAFGTKLFDTLYVNKLLLELIEEMYVATDDVVKTMRLQRFYDIVDKWLALVRKSKKLSCDERTNMRKLINENYNDMKAVYKPAFRRIFIVGRHIFRKIISVMFV